MSVDMVELERAADRLLDDWREVAVADVVTMLPGFAFKSENFVTDTDAGLPLIRIRDLGLTNTATRYVGDYDETFAVRDGDILVGMDGSFEAVRWQGGKALLNQRVLKLSSARPDAIDEGYLFYRVQPALSELEQTISGTTVKHLSTKDLKRLVWKLPLLDEQRRIAEVLRSVDEAIAAAKQTLDFCADLLITKRRATFQHLIVDPDNDAIRLGDICELGRGFAFKSENYVDEGVLNFRVTNVGKPASDLGEQRFLPPSFMDEYEEYVLFGGEVVLVMVGATVGKLGRVPKAVCPALLNQNMWTLAAKEPFDRDLLWHLAHVLIEEKVHGAQGGAYSFLTKKDFLEHRISRFDVAEIAEAVANLSAVEQYAQGLADELRQLHSLKASLMSDLLSGRVRVPS